MDTYTGKPIAKETIAHRLDRAVPYVEGDHPVTRYEEVTVYYVSKYGTPYSTVKFKADGKDEDTRNESGIAIKMDGYNLTIRQYSNWITLNLHTIYGMAVAEVIEVKEDTMSSFETITFTVCYS